MRARPGVAQLCSSLSRTSRGSLKPQSGVMPDQKLQLILTISVNIPAERFAIKEQQVTSTGNSKQYKGAREGDKATLAALRNTEEGAGPPHWHRSMGRDRARKWGVFGANLFQFTKKLLGQNWSGHLACLKEEMDCFLNSTYTINSKEPTWRRSRRLSGLLEQAWQYLEKVYKRCPRLLRQLSRILEVIWSRRKVAQRWRSFKGVWIPEENTFTIEHFRVISNLSVSRYSSVLFRDKYSTSWKLHLYLYFRKGESRRSQGGQPRDSCEDLVLTIAYGSIPLKLVETLLVQHHIPGKIRDLILDY